MPNYKDARKAYRDAQQELWRAREEEKKAEADVQEAIRNGEILNQIMGDYRKRANLWRDSAANQIYGQLQAEIRDAIGDMYEYDSMEAPLNILVETLDEIAASETQTAILDHLAEEWNQTRQPEEHISRALLKEAQETLAQRQQAGPESLKTSQATLDSLQQEAQEMQRKGDSDLAALYWSEKLPHEEKQQKLLKKYGTSARTIMRAGLDAEIKKQSDLGIDSLDAFDKQEAELQARTAELQNLQRTDIADSPSYLPDDIDKIRRLSDDHTGKKAISQQLSAYEARVSALHDAEERAITLSLPPTFSEYRKLGKREKDIKEAQINQLLKQKRESDRTKYKDYPENLAAYFALEEQYANLKSDGTEKQKRELEQFKEKKAQIKQWFREYNSQQETSLKEAEAKKKQAEKEEKKALSALKKAISNHNTALKEDRERRLKEISAEIKPLEKKHEALKKKLGTLISKHNAANRAAWEARKATLAKDLADNAAKQKDAQKAIDQESLLQSSAESAETARQEVLRQTQGLEALLRQENVKRKEHNASISANNRERMKLRGDKSRQAQDFWNQKRKLRESEFKKAERKRKAVGMAAATMETVTVKYRDMLIMLTDAVIKADLKNALEQKEKLEQELSAARNALTASTTRMAERTSWTPSPQAIYQQAQDGSHQRHAEEATERIRELSQKLAEQAQTIEKLQLEEPQRIAENHAAIDAAFGIPADFDLQRETKRLAYMQEISQAAAGENEIQRQLAASRGAYDSQEAEEFAVSVEEQVRQIEKSLDFVEAKSDAVSSFLTAPMQERIDLVLNVGKKVIDYLTNKASEERESDAPAESDINATLQSIKERLQAQPQDNGHIIDNLLEVGKVLYPIMQQKNTEIQEFYAETARKSTECREIHENMEELQMGFEMYQQRRAQKIQVLNSDYATDLLNFLDQRDDDVKHITGEMLQLKEREAQLAESRSSHQSQVVIPDQLQLQSDKAAAVIQQEQACTDVETEMRDAFLETLAATENDWKTKGTDRYSYLDDQQLMIGEMTGQEDGKLDFAFLSALTRVDFHEGMDIKDAMDAFSRIYINGLNASAYFQLGDRYTQALGNDLEFQRDLLREMATHGEEIKMAIHHIANPQASADLPDGAKRLENQFIAIEDETCMRLSPVLLSGDSPQAQSYNRLSIMVSDSLNESRNVTAHAKLEKTSPQESMEDTSAVPLKRRISLQELTNAVHASRTESLVSPSKSRASQTVTRSAVSGMQR